MEAKELIEFIEKSPTAFQAISTISEMLKKDGAQVLKEEDAWKLEKGKTYYVTKGSSAIIAFHIPEQFEGYRIMASHSDSPSFKIKENPEMEEAGYVKLNVEKYGGMLMAPWFDRPLSVAGRVIVKENGEFVEKPVHIKENMLIIPSLAIHMNREANNGYAYNPQKDTLPLYALAEGKGTFMDVVAEHAGVKKEDILGNDLFLYDRTPGSVWGQKSEFVSAPRLDNLACAYGTLKGFLKGKKEKYLDIYVVFDHEEVGSGTKEGASATFLKDTIERIELLLGFNKEDQIRHLAKSFMVSADNAHAVHPNYTEKADPVNRPKVGSGVVLKFNANQKYCTDAMSAAMFRDLCNQVGADVQDFTNRSDVPGGSTLGNLANMQVSMHTVDIGLPQLAMHSPYETAGTKDVEDLCKISEAFYC
ncbi:MAG: M18 family aminopeptidase [Lachnospiraceae bacterium]|nr:M18 family aminopeptidase [Lachnospiraceae bacterium]